MSEIIRLQSGEAQVARKALERCVSGGGVAVFPSDGLYGLACDPLDAGAIATVHRLKGRDDGKPSAVMYFSPLAIRELVSGFGPRTKAAVSALLPGPVTLVVANPLRRYPLACREDPERLGIRLIGGPLAGAMCPVFQTSANLSGEPAPARFEDVPDAIRRRRRPGDRRRRADRGCPRPWSTSPRSRTTAPGGSSARAPSLPATWPASWPRSAWADAPGLRPGAKARCQQPESPL